MPLRTQRYDLSDEIDRIDNEIAELKATKQDLTDADEDKADAIKKVKQRITQLESQQRGARWARDEAHYSPSEGGIESWNHAVDSIELAGLTAGDMAQVSAEMTVTHHAVQRIHMVAQGTEDAPYHDASASYGDRVEAVGKLPVAYIRWAYSRVDSLSTVGNTERTASEPTPKATRSQTPTSD
ncbi:hypothetical protein C440_05687 [Haloferax mucosum ATCC BAA-1512]|uniref:Uncharacterized protein n=1 Tax=Haloferax mucosum ATCC BAA-1512 TaxID=662479 RepID=M0IJ60_9EURY|nr:hypothetical protein [Haloferax mucosum]ELZ96057.1 hypothetical protein C440_05687 [Haloferax mucosum ATCC BAA-1512]